MTTVQLLAQFLDELVEEGRQPELIVDYLQSTLHSLGRVSDESAQGILKASLNARWKEAA